jgi:rRNA maturation protein Nop10
MKFKNENKQLIRLGAKLKLSVKKILSPKKTETLQCKSCGSTFSKADVPVSGWIEYGLHRHCPVCGNIIESNINQK